MRKMPERLDKEKLILTLGIIALSTLAFLAGMLIGSSLHCP